MKRLLALAFLSLPALASAQSADPDKIDRYRTAGGTISPTQGVTQVYPIYTLATDGSPSAAQRIAAGTYYVTLPPAINGATETLTVTANNLTSQSFVYSASSITSPIITVGAGSTVSLAITGGTPTGATMLNGFPSGGGTPASPQATYTVQPATASYRQIVLTANTRAQMTAITGMTNGVVCTASANNAADVLVGDSTVTTSETGTGNGFPMPAGGSWSEGLSTTVSTYFISSAAAVLFCHGN